MPSAPRPQMRPTALPAWFPRARSVRSVAWSAGAPGQGAYRREYSLSRASSPVSASATPTTASRTTRPLTALPGCLTTFLTAAGDERLFLALAGPGGHGLARRTVPAIPSVAARLRAVAGVSGVTLGLRLQRFHRQAQPPALVAIDQLHLHPISLLHDVFRSLRAAVAHLRDVQQGLGAGQDLHERAERRRALHEAFVRLADDRLLRDRLHHLTRTLHGLAAYGRDSHRTGVVDRDLGARFILDAANGLALRSDQVADLIGVDLDGHDTRCVRRQVGLRRRERLVHLCENVQPAHARLIERLSHDRKVESFDLAVHLNRRDP